jgi:multicomponent Na+:H+ antiporter subunit D
MMRHLPVIIVLLPLFTAIMTPLLPKRKELIFILSMIALSFMLGLAVISFMDVNQSGLFTYVFGNYAPNIGIEFKIDGLIAFLVVFIVFLAWVITLYSFKSIQKEIKEHQVSAYYSLVMLMLFSVMGMLYTNDLFNMYVFMEILSITSTAIISIQHRKENFLASFRYLMLSSIGSLTILLGLAFLYMVSGQLNMDAMRVLMPSIWVLYPTNVVLAVGFILSGFAIKSAMFPLHVWLPDAYTYAPNSSSAYLASFVGKVYMVSMIKFMFRVIGVDIIEALNIDNFILIMAALGMILGSIFAIGQKDIKRLLAYSSVAQVGYVFMGLGLLSEAGLAAAVFHIVSHALMKSALFLSAGSMMYVTGKRRLNQFDGIGFRMPITMVIFAIAAAGMVGIPGVSGFMSKIYLGLALIGDRHPIYLSLILLSSFLNAIYFMPILISAFLKESPEQKNQLQKDPLPKTMVISMVFLAIAMLVVGYFPQTIMHIIEAAVGLYF